MSLTPARAAGERGRSPSSALALVKFLNELISLLGAFRNLHATLLDFVNQRPCVVTDTVAVFLLLDRPLRSPDRGFALVFEKLRQGFFYRSALLDNRFGGILPE